MAAAINLQRDAGVLLSNMQVLGQICLIWGWDVWCSLRRRSQLCLRVAGASGGPVHGRDGFMASSDPDRCQLRPAMHAWPVVAAFRRGRYLRGSDSSSSCDTWTIWLGCWWPESGTDYETFNMTYLWQLTLRWFLWLLCGHICFDVVRLQLVSCCPAPFLGAPVFLDHVVYMFLVLYRPLCSTSACCIVLLGISDLLQLEFFSGWPPCVRYFRKFKFGVSSDRSLFLARLCWGGGGGVRLCSVAIVQWGLHIILRIWLLGRGLYIVHETGRRRWFGVAA